ncbi:MAG TPA: MFS transporter [Methylomirabilota bacterium]|nr:MFS transporter [Methylomirabilota bacterium]
MAALFLVTCGMAIPLAAYGVFLPVLSEALGWSRGAISTALSINLLVGGVAGFGIGALADRYGPRVMLVLTVMLAGAAFALVSLVGAIWQLYLFVGVLGGVGTSSFYLLSATTIARWFKERRGLALSLVLVGFNLGYVSAGPLAAWLIAEFGWRTAYAALGVGAGLIALLGAVSVRTPQRAEPGSTDRHDRATAVALDGVTIGQALRDPRQWCLNASWLLQGGLVFMVTVHIVPFARDQGLSLAGASLALTTYGAGAFAGRLVGGVASDRLGTLTAIRAGFIAMTLAMAVVAWVPSRVAMLASMAAFGAGFAAADTMVAKVIPDVFGLRAIGAIMGVLNFGWRLGAALGPAAAGFLFDRTGSYTVAFGVAPFAVLFAWALFSLGTSRVRMT